MDESVKNHRARDHMKYPKSELRKNKIRDDEINEMIYDKNDERTPGLELVPPIENDYLVMRKF